MEREPNPLNKPFQHERPPADMREAEEREAVLTAEVKRLQGRWSETTRELSDQRKLTAAREQQILDLGRLLVQHKINWQKEAVWTDPTQTPPRG